MAPASRSSPASRTSIGTTKYKDVGMPPKILNQLTQLLSMNPSIPIPNPDESWLRQQEAEVEGLDASLRLPKGLIRQLIFRLSIHHHHVRFLHLCPSHHSLNPWTIRNIMLLIKSELTRRVDRFRVWRTRMAFPECIKAWLSRVDATTTLWINRDTAASTFASFGYERPPIVPQRVESGCEACILGVVGGRPQILADLRASIYARQRRHSSKRTRKEPRLWPIIESWITQFDDGVSNGIIAASDVIVEQIEKLDRAIAIKEKGLRATVSMKDTSPFLDQGKKSSDVEPGESHRVSTHRELQTSSFCGHQAVSNDNPFPCCDDRDIGETDENWDWIRDPLRAPSLLPEQGRGELNDIDLAFEQYTPPSVIQNPLDVDKTSVNKMPIPKTSVRSSRRSSWITVTAHSNGEEDFHTTEVEPNLFQATSVTSKYPPMPEIPDISLPLPKSGQQQARGETVSDTGVYVPARRHWNKLKTAPVPGSPASSVYSTHQAIHKSKACPSARATSVSRPLPSDLQPLLGQESTRTKSSSSAPLSHAPCAVGSPSGSGIPSSAHSLHESGIRD
ncbi:hypothetical protein BGZ63DRAFT_420017 [Mariannaea sp. PMI_226]|nr:hypothetical protein BGZ63DRAFT_420017 [Mariannaea sp. PMI_226]